MHTVSFGAYPVLIVFFIILAIVFSLIVKSSRKKKSKDMTPHYPHPEVPPVTSTSSESSQFAEKYSVPAASEASAKLISLTEFWRISKKSYVAFDLETTGLDSGSDRIVEIGAVRVVNGEIVAEFHRMINPGIPMPDAASKVNHITDDMLVGAPPIKEVFPFFIDFVGDDLLVAHNARFDAGFIMQNCLRQKLKNPERYFDTMSLSRYWPELESKKLSCFVDAAGLVNDESHRALSDAKILVEVINASYERKLLIERQRREENANANK